MSSYRNASKSYQKTHRERHQLKGREELGLLEKKRDWKERAEDFNRKKAELQLLRRKALDRNPEEFYFSMISSQIEDGVHRGKSKSVDMSTEQIHLMQTQDKRYISSRRLIELRKVDRLNATLQRLEEAPLNKQKFFTDDEKQLRKFRLAQRLDTPVDLLGRNYNRLTTTQLEKVDLAKAVKDAATLETCKKLVSKGYKELQRRTDRKNKLSTLEDKMRLKQILQGKDKKRIQKRVAPETKDAAPIYLFRQQRLK